MPQDSMGRLAAARHYVRVTGLLAWRAWHDKTVDRAARDALRQQVIDEGIIVFHLARHLSRQHRSVLYAELRQMRFVALLWRNACHATHVRRIWRRSLRYQIASAGIWLGMLLAGVMANDLASITGLVAESGARGEEVETDSRFLSASD